MSSEIPGGGPRLTRRQLLEVMGVAGGTAALAACGANNQPASSKNPEKVFDGGWPYQVPPVGHFNIAMVTNMILFDGIYGDIICPSSGMYYWTTQKWEYLMAEKWGFTTDGQSFSLTLKSGLKWSDGKNVTSTDLADSLWVLWIMQFPLWSYIDGVTTPDTHTVNVHMKTPSTVVERYVARQYIYSSATFGQYAARARDLFNSGQSIQSTAGKQLAEQFQAYRPKEIISSGPFNIDYSTITNSQLELVKVPTGYAAKTCLFDKCVIYNGETPVITPIVLQKKVDYATHGFPPATVDQFKAEGIRIARPPVYSGYGGFFNLGRWPEFQDVRIRQAFAYIIDRAQSATVTMGQSATPVKYMAGFSDIFVPDWMSPSDIAKLNLYPHNLSKATSLLEAAGWKKVGSQWMKADGTPAKYEILFEAEYADTSASCQDAASQLTKFGINVTGHSETFTQVPIDIDKGNFDLVGAGWGSSASPHPYFAFVSNLMTYNYPISENNGGRGMDFPMIQQTQTFGQVNLTDLINNSALGLDQSKQKSLVSKIALVFNELMPMMIFSNRLGDNPCLEGVRVKSWPPDSDPIMSNAPYGDNFTTMLMLMGKLAPT
jgi:peptide/nickel transport system substrate-binding protein